MRQGSALLPNSPFSSGGAPLASSWTGASMLSRPSSIFATLTEGAERTPSREQRFPDGEQGAHSDEGDPDSPAARSPAPIAARAARQRRIKPRRSSLTRRYESGEGFLRSGGGVVEGLTDTESVGDLGSTAAAPSEGSLTQAAAELVATTSSLLPTSLLGALSNPIAGSFTGSFTSLFGDDTEEAPSIRSIRASPVSTTPRERPRPGRISRGSGRSSEQLD